MASRAKQDQVKTDLFPFLSVLICSMGAVVGLLFMVVYQANRNAQNNKQNQMAKLLEQRDLFAQGMEIKELMDGDIDDSIKRIQEEKEEREGNLQYLRELGEMDPQELEKKYELSFTAQQEKERLAEEEKKREEELERERLSKIQMIEVTAAEFEALAKLASLSESLALNEAEMKRRQEEFKSLEKQAAALTEKEREDQSAIRREQSMVDVRKTEHSAKKKSVEEMLREIEELKRKIKNLEIPHHVTGEIMMPGVGEPVSAEFTRVPYICEAGGVWKMTSENQLVAIDMSNDLALQIEKESLASDPNIIVQFFLKHGGESNYYKLRRVFAGLNTGFYPVSEDWDISMAKSAE